MIAVEEAPGYRSGDAFKIIYKLVDKRDSNEYQKTEIFINSLENKRTEDFVQYLEGSGICIDSFDDIVGLRETMTLQYELKDGQTFLNISSREVEVGEE